MMTFVPPYFNSQSSRVANYEKHINQMSQGSDNNLAEIITIGDELLIGQVVDTNSAWMAQRLNEIGIRVKQISSVSDDSQLILQALEEASSRADVILITGGLGPTKDD